MKQSGWMVNIRARRVDYVVATRSPLRRPDYNMHRAAGYGPYQGPDRTYMLRDDQVFDTELAAMRWLWVRMGEQYDDIKDKLYKHETEYRAVSAALQSLTKEGGK